MVIGGVLMFFTGLSKFLQFFIDAIGSLLQALVLLLPKSPFNWIQGTGFGDLLNKINYFIPVSDFLVMIQAWLVAIALFYAYSIYARFVKAID